MLTQNLKDKREVEDLKKTLNSHSSTISSQNEKIKSNTSKVNLICQQVDNLQNQIDNLGEGSQSGGDLQQVAITGQYNDLKGRPDEFFEMGTSFKAFRNQVWGIDRKGERTQDYWFTCAVDCVIEGSIKIVYRGSRRVTSLNEEIQFLFNNEVVSKHEITMLNAADTTVTLEFKIRPKKSLNCIAVNMTRNGSWMGEGIIGYFDLDIPYGKNIFFLSRSFNWHATVYKDKYLISKNNFPHNIFYKKSKDDFDFSTGAEVIDSKVGKNLILSYAPYYPSNSQYLTQMNYDEVLCIGLDSDNYYPRISGYNTDVFQRMISSEVVHAYSITYFKDVGKDYSCPGVAVVTGEERKLGFLETGQKNNVPVEYTLNDIPVESGVWVDNSAVMKQDMDGVIARDYRGSVAMKFNGECIFFPHIYSTYCVPMGFGRRVNVFLQENENIHVYLGRQNHVIKKVLVKNLETNQYEIDDSQELRINGYDEIIETLDGYFIGLSDDLPELVSWDEI